MSKTSTPPPQKQWIDQKFDSFLATSPCKLQALALARELDDLLIGPDLEG